jgi:virginiamycin B lyase
MLKHRLLWGVAAIAAATFGPGMTGALAADAPSLQGQVSSPQEAKMEGVVVTAKKQGSTVAVSVMSDQDGHYVFPAGRLEPGAYAIKIRAIGYDLDGAGTATVDGEQTATVDLKLKKTRNIVPQMTNAEWMASVPGTEAQKNTLLNCVGCHTLERVVRSTHDVNEWMQVVYRMNNYAQVSQPIKPQKRMDPNWGGKPEDYRAMAEFLATINLSAVSQWEYPLKTLPRPTGRATHVITTTYDLPRPTIEPHDVIVDNQGIAWYSDFGEQFFGRLDPKTGAIKEWPVPELKPGFPVGMLDLEPDPKNGTFWLGMMFQGALANFDPKTEQFKLYPINKELSDSVTQLNMLGLQYAVDGKVWTNNAGNQDIYRVDLKTGNYETFHPGKALDGNHRFAFYGIDSDSQNNLYFTEFLSNYIGRIDAKTGQTTFFQTPTPKSRPRRVQMDNQDRLWFAEYQGNRVAMLDTKSEKFTEWALPTEFTGPYYVTFDKNGELWTGGMTTDRVVRLDPKTGKTVEYLMPQDTNMRRVFVDNSTTPVTFWTGSNHTAQIVRVEPLD